MWVVRDYPERSPCSFSVSDFIDGVALTCREIALRRVRVCYPRDQWQGPLESEWEFCDRDWREARATYRNELLYAWPPWGDVEIERRLSLRFPDDDEVDRVEFVWHLVGAFQRLRGEPVVRPMVRPLLGARPHGRVETCFVEEGAPRFAGWIE